MRAMRHVTMRRVKVPLLTLAGLTLLGGHAHAHAFRGGLDYYEQFQEGVSVILAYPGTLFPILAVGILVGLWHADGILRALPFFMIGLLIGLPLAALAGPAVALWLIALGFGTAVLAALLPVHHRLEVWILSFATGVLAMVTSLEGHGFFELPVAIHLGIFLAALFAFVASANATRLVVSRFSGPVGTIAFRIAASWIAAALVLFLAFEWRG